MRAALREILRAGGIPEEESPESIAAKREADARLLAAGQRWAGEVAATVNDREADQDFRLWSADFLTLDRDLLWSQTSAPARDEVLDGFAVRIARARALEAQAAAETRVAHGITWSWASGHLGISDDDGRLDVLRTTRRIDELLGAEAATVDINLAINEAVDLGLSEEAAHEIMDAFSDPTGTSSN